MKKMTNYGLIILPLLLAGIVSLLVSFDMYSKINLPSIAPPAILFPIVWTILYLMMGISLFLNRNNKKNMMIFYIQLAINYLWVFLFFMFEMFLGSFMLIVLLDVLVIYTILEFYKENKASAYMLIPYLLWSVFASYLNWQIFLLN
jgi:tryptophan-rich sensory protein